MNKIRSKKEKHFQRGIAIFMILIMFIAVYPVWYSLINSLNSADYIAKNGFSMLWMGEFTLDSWKAVLQNTDIIKALGVTVLRTVAVTVLQTIITAMFAYGFSRKYLRGQKFYTVIGLISMYLNGGVIAYFLLFNVMGLYDSIWVYIIPCLFGGFYNVIIFKANFDGIPDSLFESARIDGANEYCIFWRIVMPLSKPVLSALGIFTSVGVWNDYTQTLYYTRSSNLQTLSYYTLSISESAEAAEKLSQNITTAAANALSGILQSSTNYRTVELACMVLSSIPLVVMYPFAQKYFEKGVMVGSIKG